MIWSISNGRYFIPQMALHPVLSFINSLYNTVEMCVGGRPISIQDLLCKKWMRHAPSQRSKGSSKLLSATSPGSVMVWGCICALGKRKLLLCDGSIDAEKSIEILEPHMLPSRRHVFRGRPCVSQEDNAKPLSARITKTRQGKARQGKARQVYL